MVEHLVIERIGHRGDGVADSADGPIFVPAALPGETVEVGEVLGHPDRRQLLRVETASPQRIAPICPHFGICGGCAMQHWETSAYRAWKRSLVVEALRQARIEAPVADLIDAHGDGRRRVVFHARRGTHDILEVGFAAARAHHVIPIDRCPVLAKSLDGALKAAWAIAELLSPLRKPLDIHATATDAGLDIDVRGSGPLTATATSALARLVAQYNLARLTRHGELVAQARAPTMRVGATTVVLPPAAFLQATAEGEHVLAQLVSEICAAAKPKKGVADLFAGIGPFALRLAEQTRVTASDDDEPALAALTRASHTPGLKPVTAERRDLFKNPFLAAELNRFDAVVFDPPRQGAQAQSREIAASRVPIVAAVSCNPGTFARDARILVDGGYQLASVTPVDQFRYSAHVELVARFERR
ncbi:MAG TPA: RNA methyltransferase [Xanthobacteraceae bacterium]|nr:RNA methyltransferase [Xanthobacteraceae bacterium]